MSKLKISVDAWDDAKLLKLDDKTVVELIANSTPKVSGLGHRQNGDYFFVVIDDEVCAINTIDVVNQSVAEALEDKCQDIPEEEPMGLVMTCPHCYEYVQACKRCGGTREITGTPLQLIANLQEKIEPEDNIKDLTS